MKVKLERLSVCECGYPALKDGIKLGKVYDLDWDCVGKATYVCGGCKQIHKMNVVWCTHGGGGWIPQCLFEAPESEMAFST